MSATTAIDWHGDIIEALRINEIRLIAHVADSVLAPIITRLESDPYFRVLTLTREEEGIGVLTGAYLGGTRGALLLQNSGFGNVSNALGSLAIPYQIPFVMLLSERGSFMEHNVVQIAGGTAVLKTLDALGLQSFEMREASDVAFMAEAGMRHAFVSRRPVALTITTQLSGGKSGR